MTVYLKDFNVTVTIASSAKRLVMSADAFDSIRRVSTIVCLGSIPVTDLWLSLSSRAVKRKIRIATSVPIEAQILSCDGVDLKNNELLIELGFSQAQQLLLTYNSTKVKISEMQICILQDWKKNDPR